MCGNGIKDLGEQCDDGNAINGDTCDNNCTVPACGNRIVDPGEQCDDGNASNGDTCENNCTTPRCGNGIRDAGEQCDDGNLTNGDGCESNCIFTPPPAPICGNGSAEPGEQCDDGNGIDFDACDNHCSTQNACNNTVRRINTSDPGAVLSMHCSVLARPGDDGGIAITAQGSSPSSTSLPDLLCWSATGSLGRNEFQSAHSGR